MTVRSSFGPSARPGFPKGLQVGGRAGRRGRALIVNEAAGGGRRTKAAPPQKIFACALPTALPPYPQVLLVTPNEADLKARLTSFEYEGA